MALELPKKLGPQHKMVIYLSAIGKSTAFIAEEMELSQQWVRFLRRELRPQIEAEIPNVKNAIVAKRAGITHLFDEEATNNFKRLKELSMGADRDSVCLKATTEMLDRSSVAPIMSKQLVASEGKTISLPIIQVMNVIKAASEDGLEAEAAEVLEIFTEDAT